MLSNELYRMIFIYCEFGSKFGAFPIEFEKTNLVFSLSKNKKVKQKFSRNKYFVIFWILISIGITINEYLVGNFNMFLQKLLFTLSIYFDGVLCSIFYIYLNDIVTFLNEMVKLLQTVNGKLKNCLV